MEARNLTSGCWQAHTPETYRGGSFLASPDSQCLLADLSVLWLIATVLQFLPLSSHDIPCVSLSSRGCHKTWHQLCCISDTPLQYGLSLIHLQPHYFWIRSHSEFLGVRTLTCFLEAGHHSAYNNRKTWSPSPTMVGGGWPYRLSPPSGQAEKLAVVPASSPYPSSLLAPAIHPFPPGAAEVPSFSLLRSLPWSSLSSRENPNTLEATAMF